MKAQKEKNEESLWEMREKKERATRKEGILEEWFSALVQPLPAERRAFLLKATDRFANPWRSQLREGLEELLDGLLSDDEKCLAKGFALIMSLFVLENVRPSEAVSFVPKLKDILKDVEEKKIQDMLLVAFDEYMYFKEKLHDLKLKERKFHISRGRW